MNPTDRSIALSRAWVAFDTASIAYHAAGRALDAGLRRPSGATRAEWLAEDDARVVLRGATRAYRAAAARFVAATHLELQALCHRGP